MEKENDNLNVKLRDQTKVADDVRSKLTPWFAKQMSTARNLVCLDVITPNAGFSADTLIMDYQWDQAGRDAHNRFVVRVLPAVELFLDADLLAEARMIKCLYEASDVPVPQIHWMCETDSPLDRPFYVMQWIEGKVPPDNPLFLTSGWVFDSSPQERTRLWASGLQALARIHDVDWKAIGVEPVSGRDAKVPAFEAELEYWHAYHDWGSSGHWAPVSESIFRWLVENKPPESETVLCWGDARPGNMLFSDDECLAVIDWEMACFGNPEVDVAWWIFIEQNYCLMGQCELLEGIPDRNEVVSIYERYSGRKLDHMHYYLTFAAFRAMTIFVRTKVLRESVGDFSVSNLPIEQTPMAILANQYMCEGDS